MGSDREIAVRREPIEDTREHTLLKGLPEVGEREIAATENEVKEQSGRFVPQVLTKEFNTLPMLRLEAVEGPHSRERVLTEAIETGAPGTERATSRSQMIFKVYGSSPEEQPADQMRAARFS
jgi:hypothetical protein